MCWDSLPSGTRCIWDQWKRPTRALTHLPRKRTFRDGTEAASFSGPVDERSTLRGRRRNNMRGQNGDEVENDLNRVFWSESECKWMDQQRNVEVRDLLGLRCIEDIVFVDRHEHEDEFAQNIHLEKDLHVVDAFLGWKHSVNSTFTQSIRNWRVCFCNSGFSLGSNPNSKIGKYWRLAMAFFFRGPNSASPYFHSIRSS